MIIQKITGVKLKRNLIVTNPCLEVDGNCNVLDIRATHILIRLSCIAKSCYDSIKNKNSKAGLNFVLYYVTIECITLFDETMSKSTFSTRVSKNYKTKLLTIKKTNCWITRAFVLLAEFP